MSESLPFTLSFKALDHNRQVILLNHVRAACWPGFAQAARQVREARLPQQQRIEARKLTMAAPKAFHGLLSQQEQ